MASAAQIPKSAKLMNKKGAYLCNFWPFGRIFVELCDQCDQIW